MPTKFRAMTINIGPELHAELAELATEKGVSIPELIRQALSFEKLMWRSRRT